MKYLLMSLLFCFGCSWYTDLTLEELESRIKNKEEYYKPLFLKNKSKGDFKNACWLANRMRREILDMCGEREYDACIFYKNYEPQDCNKLKNNNFPVGTIDPNRPYNPEHDPTDYSKPHDESQD